MSTPLTKYMEKCEEANAADQQMPYERTISEWLIRNAVKHNDTSEGVNLRFRVTKDGFVIMYTDDGAFWFAIDPEDKQMIVHQVI
jgi:hypothetical protein